MFQVKDKLAWNEHAHFHPTAYYNRGIAYYNKGQLDLAINNYDKAIELDPQLANAYYGRAIIFITSKKINEAITDFKTFLIYTDPNSTEAEFVKRRIKELGGTL